MLRFSLGQTVATPGALEALIEANQIPLALLARHASGDWGEVCDDDKECNNAALEDGCRLLSAYTLTTGVKVWIITEWEHSETTILLPIES